MIGREQVSVGEHVAFDHGVWDVDGAGVDALGPRSTGVWAVSTRGSLHVWDLDRRVFCRQPSAESHAGRMPYDRIVLPIGRIQTFPVVGGRLHLWFDDPEQAGPATVEHFRISSSVRSIRAMRPCRCADGAHGGAHLDRSG